MGDITIKGNVYRTGKLDALTQFHVTRRLGPALVVAGISVDAVRSGMKVELGELVAIAGPVMELLARMSDDDVNYVIFACLRKVERQQGSAWAPIVAPGQQGLLMFADIEMPAMLRLVVEILKDNLGNFLTELGGEPT